jgi:hypothetical protein
VNKHARSLQHKGCELLARMGRAARGRNNILITADELCRSISREDLMSFFCCDAMQAEMKLGDTLLLARTSNAGMTVRYRLPRTH